MFRITKQRLLTGLSVVAVLGAVGGAIAYYWSVSGSGTAGSPGTITLSGTAPLKVQTIRRGGPVLGSRGAGTDERPGEGRRPGARLAAVLLAVCALALLSAGGAYAYWTLTATGSGAAVAASVGAGAKPTVSAASKAVTVTWSASTLSNGVAVSGYLVKRYAVGGETAQVALAGCSGTIAALTCTEAGVHEGQWQYTVTPVFGAFWQGHESARSEKLTIKHNQAALQTPATVQSPAGTGGTPGETAGTSSEAAGAPGEVKGQ